MLFSSVFVQAHINISRPYEGSGLGLSIAKAYTKMLSGSVYVESEEEIGSTFYFSMNFDTFTTKGNINRN